MTKDNTRKKISEIFVKWHLPTRQIAINDLLTLITEEKDKAVTDAFDWIWDGWNLDLANKDRAKKHFLAALKEKKDYE